MCLHLQLVSLEVLQHQDFDAYLCRVLTQTKLLGGNGYLHLALTAIRSHAFCHNHLVMLVQLVISLARQQDSHWLSHDC